MIKQHLQFLLQSNVDEEALKEFQLDHFKNFLQGIEGVTLDGDKFYFATRFINNYDNIEYIKSMYPLLRKVFGIKPYSRLPDKKKISSVILCISKLFTGVEITNKRVYCIIDGKSNTSGYYSIDLNPRPLPALLHFVGST